MLRIGMSRLAVILFVGGVVILGAVVIIPNSPSRGRYGMAKAAKDLEQVRGMGNAFALYYKKYGYYPTFTNMTANPPPGNISGARKNGGHPACLALKLLLAEDLTEHRYFFTPQGEQPTANTLETISKTSDPRKDPIWACTYAYDPGHNPNHGSVPFYGNTYQIASKSAFEKTTHVLTCELVAKEIEAEPDGQYVISNHKIDSKEIIIDNIYADDSPTLGWRDSYLQWDVPGNLP